MVKRKGCLGTIILLILVFILSGCDSSKKIVEVNGQEWSLITNKEEGIEFAYPYGWDVRNAEGAEMVGIVFEPEFIAEETNPGANLNFKVEMYPYIAPSAEEQANVTKSWWANMAGMKEFKKMAFTPMKIGELNAGIADYEYTASQDDVCLRIRQLIVPRGQKSYVLTMTIDKESWQKYEPIFQQIIESFKFI